jgi:DNA topoisomerase-6 subunit B
MVELKAEEIFKEFRQHSVAEFFKKNRQMLGYSGMTRSLVTIVHEYVTNSLDACEEAGILPDIEVRITEAGENRYRVMVSDNGPGIPKNYIGKVLATILAGTKFHRYMQQRGQQGIGGSGCTLFSQITTGKPIAATSMTGTGKGYTCTISLDTVHNKPVIGDYKELDGLKRGLTIEGEFAEIKYENSDHGVYEYLRRTALSNPHAQIKFTDPTGQEYAFLRAIEAMPLRPKAIKPHPLGLTVNDLIDFAQVSESRKLSSFMTDTFSRFSQDKVNEIAGIATSVNMGKAPKDITWDDAEALIKAFKSVKWIAPDATSVIPIGEEQVKIAMKNILNPEFMNVVERKPKVFRGGVPFIVEAAVAYGGNAGKKTDEGYEGNLLRFANRVPLLFDSGTCAITAASKNMDWKRYNIDIEAQPISIFVNVSSVYIPYSGVGKEAISQESEVVDEIKLAIMEAARGVQRYISGKLQVSHETSKYKTIIRYTEQLSKDLSDLTGEDREAIDRSLEKLVAKHYPKAYVGEEEEAIEKSEDTSGESDEGGEN